MSTLHTNTVETSSGGPVTLTKQSAAKAWVNAGNDATNNGSFNVASTTDHAVGQFSYTLTNAYNSVNDYSLTTVMGGTGGGWSVSRFHTYHSASVMAVRVVNGGSSHADGDAPHNVTSHGDLA
jgi:hypothetical protein